MIWSVVAGAVLMIGHRRIARPYMTAVAASKCLWCNRVPPRPGGGGELELETRAGVLRPVFCPGHDIPLARFFAFLDAWRWPLRLGIFVPLATLLGALVASAAGRSLPLGAITAGFQLIVGLTVLASAVGYRASAPAPRARVPFPLHNFYLLGVRALLWIFRLVGAWWVLRGARYLLAA